MAPSRIGILTGGGDAPGLNAVIRAVVRASTNAGFVCVGLEDSFDGLIFPGRARTLTPADVVGIHRIGGTILGTTNRGNPFSYPTTGGAVEDYSSRVVAGYRDLALDALVVVGGDGTLAIAHRFHQRGLPIVCVPKTIDNDLPETTMTFGFDTAVAFATEAIDRLHTTAESHHRVMVVEVMGRYAGWIALYAAVAGGADVALIPEIPFDLDRVVACLRTREARGSRSSIIVVAEGARPRDGHAVVRVEARGGRAERLGGIAEWVAQQIEVRAGKESRFVVLGHLQRGGGPLAYDRVLAARFGSAAVDMIRDGRFGVMVALRSPDIVAVPLEQLVGRMRTVPLDHDVIRVARNLDMSLGD